VFEINLRAQAPVLFLESFPVPHILQRQSGEIGDTGQKLQVAFVKGLKAIPTIEVDDSRRRSACE